MWKKLTTLTIPIFAQLKPVPRRVGMLWLIGLGLVGLGLKQGYPVASAVVGGTNFAAIGLAGLIALLSTTVQRRWWKAAPLKGHMVFELLLGTVLFGSLGLATLVLEFLGRPVEQSVGVVVGVFALGSRGESAEGASSVTRTRA